MHLSFIKNRNYITNTLRTTAQLGNEVAKNMAPTAAGVISENTKYINNKLSNIAKINQNDNTYKSYNELIKESINSLKDESNSDKEVSKSISKIKKFVATNDPIMDYIDDDTAQSDIQNIQNDANVIMKTGIKTTLSVIYTINNNITTVQFTKLSKAHKYLVLINDFNQDKTIKYYNIISERFRSVLEILSNIKTRLSVLAKFEQGAYQVNNKYNELRTIVNTLHMFSSDYYQSKMMGNEAHEVAMNFITDQAPPLISNIANVISSIAPTPIKEALNETESLLKITPLLLNRKYESMMNSSDNHLQSAMGSAFYKKINSEPYEKGNMGYDGITRRSLMNTIPSGLAKILNIVNGYDNPLKEKVFDYEQDVFMTGETVYQHATDEYEFNKNRTDTTIYGYKNLVINKLEKENLLTDSNKNEVDNAINRIINEKLIPSKLINLSRNDKVDAILKETYAELSPYEKTRFIHHVFNTMKTPEEIISENESYHNVLDVIGLQDIIPKHKFDFKNELSKYLIGKNYNGLVAFIDQKPDNENPYKPGSAMYNIVEGIHSANTLLSELLFGVPNGKKSELSIIGEKSLIFVGKTADSAVEAYKKYISSDRRGTKLLQDIKDTGLIRATTDYLKFIWSELKNNGVGKWIYSTLITPIANFAKVHIFDKLAEGYNLLVTSLKNKASKLENNTPEAKHATRKKMTLERVYQIKIKKNIKTVGKTIKDELTSNIINLNNDIKSLNPIIDDGYERTLLRVFDDKLNKELAERQDEYNKKHEFEIKSISRIASFAVKLMGIVKSAFRGIKAAKDIRPDIEKRSFFEKMKDIIDHGREEKRKRTTTKAHIFKNAATLMYNVVDLKLITPFKTIVTVMKDNRKALWNIMKNTISIAVNFYTKVMVPIKIFNLYKNHILGIHVFFETKRFAFAVKRQIIKEAIATVKEVARINKSFKKVYKINPEYEQIGFTTKKINIVGGYLDNIHEKVIMDEYINSYQRSKFKISNEQKDDENDQSKVEMVAEKHKRTITDRIKDRLEDITDFLIDKTGNATKKVFSGVGSFAKGVTGTLFVSLFKKTKVSNIVGKIKSTFKGTKTDLDARIEHVYVIGGHLTNGGIDGINNIGKRKTGTDIDDTIDDVTKGKHGKFKKAGLVIATVAGATFAMKKLINKDEENEEDQKSTAEPAPESNQESAITNTSSAKPINEISETTNKSDTTTTIIMDPINLENNVNLKSAKIQDEELTPEQSQEYIDDRKIKENKAGIQLRNKADKDIVTASQLQLNSSIFTSSMVPITKLKSIDARLMGNYYIDKKYNEKIEKEFMNKLSATELEEYKANKNASLLAAKMRMGNKSLIDILMSEDSLGALVKGGLSFEGAQRLVDEYVKQSGLTRIKYNVGNGYGNGGGGVADPGTAPLADGDMFGKVSSQFETGKTDYTGADMIGRVDGDAGGASYGLPMFTTNQGSAAAFSKWLAERYGNIFGSKLSTLSPGSSAFDQAWHEAYNTNPQLFAQAQEGFIVEQTTLPLLSWIQSNLGVDFNKTRALQEAAHATGIAYGLAGAKTIFKKSGLSSGDNEETLIKKLYQEKRNSVGTYKYLGCSKQVQESVFNRYHREEKVLLGMLGLPAVNLQSLLGSTGGTSNADIAIENAVTENAINMLNNTLENAVINKDNIRDIIKNIKSMQILKDDIEIQQLIEIISVLDKMSNNSSKLKNDNIILRYSDEFSDKPNKKILKNVFIGGHEGKLI